MAQNVFIVELNETAKLFHKQSGKEKRDMAANMSGIRYVEALKPSHFMPREEPPTPDPKDPFGVILAHEMIGVDKLHADKITGNGIKIGIIDTGIDYKHPSLGGGFGPGHKVVGGWDFVGDAYDGFNNPVPGPDPHDKCSGHGTHVAGIIGAESNEKSKITLKGVAYEASLNAYRVGGCKGIPSEDAIAKAFLRGEKDGQDILVLAGGQIKGWTESALSRVAKRVASKNVVVITAAGNSGSAGSWYASSPLGGSGKNVISVASVETNVIPMLTALVRDKSDVQRGQKAILYMTKSGHPLHVEKPLPIFATSTDTNVADDACHRLPDGTPSLSEYLVIIRMGTCPVRQKLGNVAAKGGKFALIYDDGRGLDLADLGDYDAGLILAADERIDAGGSYGPAYDMFLGPSLAAPGTHIASTWPMELGRYCVLSGTSMAASFVAGSVALLLDAIKQGRTPAMVKNDIRARLQTTAQLIQSSRSHGPLWQTATKQGAGMINIYNAINYKTVVIPGELLLNDTTHFNGKHIITIYNMGPDPQTYKVSHIPAGTALTVEPNGILPKLGPVPLGSPSASKYVDLVPPTFDLPTGGHTTVLATISLPKGLSQTTFPVFSGFIKVEGKAENGKVETLHVTYMSLAASLKEKPIIDNMIGTFEKFPLPAIVNKDNRVQERPAEYTLLNGDIPTLVFQLAFGTAKLLVDLVDAHIDLQPSLESSYDDFPTDNPSIRCTGMKTVGNIETRSWVQRNRPLDDRSVGGFKDEVVAIDKFSNKKAIPNGDYRVLLRALRVTGDPSRLGDCESWLSPIVRIKAPKKLAKWCCS
ncbi:hypothetical protein AMATHDRAFT_7645 [Amanita thiersii Skay4041]|uniref:Peptidase S8/S53 domain-containing protein n=1 Tax=Amanita thiersii Skay4041 TaxID=703135 RepID=A0A2A9NE94_9AGAR|nr:hypothetical protein AMATHDRAFT_7645 [Amanita thiersii Skay4041]